MGLIGAYCSHRCSPEARPYWLTAKPHPISLPYPRFAAVGLIPGRRGHSWDAHPLLAPIWFCPKEQKG